MPIFETLPSALTGAVTAPLLCTKADVDEEGRFGERWLILTQDEALVYASDARLMHRLPISTVHGAKTEGAIGGGLLVADTEDGPFVLVRFTAALSKKFSVAARAILALAKNESLPAISEKDLPRQCPTCQRPLQEGTNVCPLCVDKGKVISRMLAYAKPYRTQMLTAAFLLLISTVLELLPPYLTKVIVDNVLQPHNTGSILLILVLMLAAASLLRSGLQTLRGYIGVWFGSRIMGDIRHDTYNALMGLSLAFFDRRQTSQFIGRVNSDAEAMRQFLTDGVVYIAGQLMTLAAIIIVMVKMDWKLAVFALLPSPLVLLASSFIWPYVRNRMYQRWRSINRLNVLVGDALQGIRVVKAFGQESLEKDRYADANQQVIDQTIRTDGMWQGVFPFFGFLTGIGGLLVWYFGGGEVLRTQISLGTLMAFTAYLGMLFGPLQWFSQLLSWTNNALTSADRIFEILDTPPDVPNAVDAAVCPRIEGRVELDQVTFGYERHQPALKEIDLKVAPGEMIGLVGHSGAGKSTLINLICRFYDPDQGRILIDGIDLRKIRQEDLHRQIGVVLQETFLFDGTIAENIAYSKPDASPEEIMRAAKIANAHHFIVRMPDGYDTRVGERGHRLSGGEKQRIAIARAVLHDPRILILDEATASVDTETERQIQEAIARLVKGRTTFAIAHRLSTLRNANRLVVLDKGQIAEEGTHEELLARQGVYYKLVEAQREMSQIKGVDG